MRKWYVRLTILSAIALALYLSLPNAYISVLSALSFIYMSTKLEKNVSEIMWFIRFVAFCIYLVGAIFNPIAWFLTIIMVVSAQMSRTY